MNPQNPNDYKQLLTDVIKKQIVILGPDITLAKARNVPGLSVTDDGTVTEITGAPQQITQALIDQFVQLSGLIVKKTMEPLLNYHSEGAAVAANMAANAAATAAAVAVTPVPPTPPTIPTVLPTTTVSPNPVQPPTPPVTAPRAPGGLEGQEGLGAGTPAAAGPTITPTVLPKTDQADSETQKIIDDALKQGA